MNSDYDGAWKDLLNTHLKELLELYFPDVAAAIDWSIPPEVLEQDLRELGIADEPADNRVDFLVKVRALDGQEALLYLHIEVQSRREAGFEARLFEYYHRIRSRCGPNVVSMAILADLDASWHPTEYRAGQLGCEVRFRFPICKLLDLLPRIGDAEGLAGLAAIAQIEGLRTRRNLDRRYAVRWQLTRRLYERGYSKEYILTALNMLARMLRLRSERALTFRRELIAYEKEKRMPYLTDTEEIAVAESLRKGLQKGRREGLVEGQIRASQESIITFLKARFKRVPASLAGAVREIKSERRLVALTAAAATCVDLESFSAKL